MERTSLSRLSPVVPMPEVVGGKSDSSFTSLCGKSMLKASALQGQRPHRPWWLLFGALRREERLAAVYRDSGVGEESRLVAKAEKPSGSEDGEQERDWQTRSAICCLWFIFRLWQFQSLVSIPPDTVVHLYWKSVGLLRCAMWFSDHWPRKSCHRTVTSRLDLCCQNEGVSPRWFHRLICRHFYLMFRHNKVKHFLF